MYDVLIMVSEKFDDAFFYDPADMCTACNNSMLEAVALTESSCVVSQNRFSECERFKHQLAKVLNLVRITTKLSMLCTMLIVVLCSLNGTSCIACVSAVHILYELYTVK